MLQLTYHMEDNKPGKQGRQTKHYWQTSFVGVGPQLGNFVFEVGFVFDFGDVVQFNINEYSFDQCE